MGRFGRNYGMLVIVLLAAMLAKSGLVGVEEWKPDQWHVHMWLGE
jgi:hypothetical protein